MGIRSQNPAFRIQPNHVSIKLVKPPHLYNQLGISQFYNQLANHLNAVKEHRASIYLLQSLVIGYTHMGVTSWLCDWVVYQFNTCLIWSSKKALF